MTESMEDRLKRIEREQVNNPETKVGKSLRKKISIIALTTLLGIGGFTFWYFSNNSSTTPNNPTYDTDHSIVDKLRTMILADKGFQEYISEFKNGTEPLGEYNYNGNNIFLIRTQDGFKAEIVLNGPHDKYKGLTVEGKTYNLIDGQTYFMIPSEELNKRVRSIKDLEVR